MFNRNSFFTHEFEAIKRLNFFQKELSLYIDLSVFDGSSRDKKVVSTIRPFLKFYIFASDPNRKLFSKQQLKDLLDVRGRFLKFYIYLIISLCKYAERTMDD